MTTQAGIWIDQRSAILVKLNNAEGGPSITRFQSEAEKQPRRSSDRPTGDFEQVNVEKDDTRDRKFKADMSNYFESITSELTAVDSLLIFGPGEAKVHFKKHVESGYRMPTSVTVETTDRMTEPEVVAKVKEFFKSN